MAISSTMVPLGAAAPAFSLESIDGETVSLSDFADAPALLVAFLCNHCPYVRHVEKTLARVADDAMQRGVAVVGICTNDAASYPDDGPEGLAGQRDRAGFAFPYLIDDTQEVGRAYGAVCTPDFFLYDSDRRLAYRGAMDAATPGNDVPVTGEELSAAVEQVLAGDPVPEPHRPSMGCSIKWRP